MAPSHETQKKPAKNGNILNPQKILSFGPPPQKKKWRVASKMIFLLQLGESFRFHALIIVGVFHPKGGELQGDLPVFSEIQLGCKRLSSPRYAFLEI